MSDALAEFSSDLEKNGLPTTLALALAVMCAVGALAWALSYSSRLYRQSIPRYAVAPPLLAQGGLAGRAAVLSAPSTDPALLLIELRAALSEALCNALGLSRLSAPEQILAELSQKRLLDAKRVAETQRLFQDLGTAQGALLSRRRLKLARARVNALGRKVMEILAEIEQRTPN